MAVKKLARSVDGRLFSSSTSTDPKTKNIHQLKEAYTQCLADHAAGADACTPIAKAYLECRMDR